MEAPKYAQNFLTSNYYLILKEKLDKNKERNKDYILLAAEIDNINTRGRILELLISQEDTEQILILKKNLINENEANVKTLDDISDYSEKYGNFNVKVDIKSKLTNLKSAPKGSDVNKTLALLLDPTNIYLFYFINIELKNKIIETRLTSIFDKDLVNIRIQPLWSGRNSRGTTQFNEKCIKKIFERKNSEINILEAKVFIKRMLNLKI